MNKKTKTSLYSREFVYNKYIDSTNKLDNFYSYISTGSIFLLLSFLKGLYLPVNNLGILKLSIILFFVTIMLNLFSFIYSTKSFELWVDEIDNKEDNKDIDVLAKRTDILFYSSIMLFFVASFLAIYFIITNI